MKKPVKLRAYCGGYIITCDDQLVKYDIAYTKEKGRAMAGKILNMRTNKFVRLAVGDLMHNCYACEKVVITSPERADYHFKGEVVLSGVIIHSLESDLAKKAIKGKWDVFMECDEKGEYNVKKLFIEFKEEKLKSKSKSIKLAK